MNPKMQSWCSRAVVALAGAIPTIAILCVAAAGVGVSSPADAADGQCKWEGGPGNPTHASCAAEDCVGNGGLAQCSAGVPAAAAPWSDSEVDPDKWVYGTCDEMAPSMPNIAKWCTSAGGEWVTSPNLQCINLPSGVLGGAGTITNSEQLAVEISDTWIGGTCGQPTDTGWGASFSSQWCTSGPTVEELDIPILQVRRRTYPVGPTCSSTFDIVLRRDRVAKCPPTYKSRTAVTGPECYLPAECCATRTGNPVSVVTGTKFQREDDYIVPAQTGIQLSRFYKSNGYYWPDDLVGMNPFGHVANTDFWRHTYDRRLLIVSGNAQVSGVLQVADGSLRVFDASGNEVTRNNGTYGTGAKLQAVSGVGWDVTLPNGDVERYNTSGRMISITALNGQVTTLVYSGVLLTTVTGPFGHTLTFGYNSEDLLAMATLPDDGIISYAYDSFNRLTSVTYPDTETKVYHYENATNRFLLTGITDENEVRFATYVYDTSGRVTSESHAGGVASRTFAFGNLGQPTTVTDPLGTSTQFAFTVAGGMYRPASYAQPCIDCGSGGTTYDTGGNIITRTDFNGVQTTYAYDTTRRLETSRTEAYGTPRARTITTQWHSTFRLPTQIDEPGRRTNFSYDSGGNVLTETVTDTTTSASRTTTLTYNGVGQVLTIDGPRSDVTDTTTLAYNTCATGGACGQLLTVTDAVSNQTTYSSYDDHGLPITITDPNGTITTLTYDERQRLTSSTANGETTELEYWPTGLLKKVTLPDGSFVAYGYDDAHRLTTVTDTDGNSIVYTLDGAGNRVEEEVFDAAETLVLRKSRTFDNLSRLESEEGSDEQTVSYTYDGDGNVLTTMDPMGRVTSYVYDELDRLATLVDAADQPTQFGYDGLDHLLSVVDPRSLATSYEYNAFGNGLELTSPDTGVSAFTRDAAGNLDVATDARNESADFTYDAVGRATEIEYADQTIELHYDEGTNGAGQLTSLDDGSGNTVWTYDALGRVLQRAQITGSVELEVGYDYDTFGRLATLTTPSGQEIAYSYTSGRVTGVTVNGLSLLEGITYEPFGPTRGWEWGNGATTVRDYDTDGQLVFLSSAGASTYAYFPDGQIKSRDDDFEVSIPTTAGTTSFTLAATSNRLTAASGLLTRTYSYDAAGNTLSDGAKSFTYDDSGRMKTSTAGGVTTTYSYNGLGERVEKTNSAATVYFAYDEAGHLLGEYDEEGELIQETVWFEDMPVATLRPDGEGGVDVYYVHVDHLNTPRRITNPADNEIIWRWDSEPYGATAAGEDPDDDTNPFTYNLRFPGQYFDDETALHYNYFRDYDAVTARYIESDPIGVAGGINTYGYARSSPTSFVDPTGLAPGMCRAVLTTAGAVVGGAGGYACGCVLGGAGGAVGGSLVPVVGTVAGGATGCGSGATLLGGFSAVGGAAAGNELANLVCGDEDPERCEKAKQEARSRYQALVTKRIPQYVSGGTGGSDATHYRSILELQRALKDAIRRVKLYCNPLPFELGEWERAANQIITPQH